MIDKLKLLNTVEHTDYSYIGQSNPELVPMITNFTISVKNILYKTIFEPKGCMPINPEIKNPSLSECIIRSKKDNLTDEELLKWNEFSLLKNSDINDKYRIINNIYKLSDKTKCKDGCRWIDENITEKNLYDSLKIFVESRCGEKEEKGRKYITFNIPGKGNKILNSEEFFSLFSIWFYTWDKLFNSEGEEIENYRIITGYLYSNVNPETGDFFREDNLLKQYLKNMNYYKIYGSGMFYRGSTGLSDFDFKPDSYVASFMSVSGDPSQALDFSIPRSLGGTGPNNYSPETDFFNFQLIKLNGYILPYNLISIVGHFGSNERESIVLPFERNKIRYIGDLDIGSKSIRQHIEKKMNEVNRENIASHNDETINTILSFVDRDISKFNSLKGTILMVFGKCNQLEYEPSWNKKYKILLREISNNKTKDSLQGELNRRNEALKYLQEEGVPEESESIKDLNKEIERLKYILQIEKYMIGGKRKKTKKKKTKKKKTKKKKTIRKNFKKKL